MLDGSLKKPPLTLSHHLEISPIACSFSAAAPQPFAPKTIRVEQLKILNISRKKNNWSLNYFFAAFKAVSISSIKSSMFSSPAETLIRSIGALASVS